MTQGLREGRLRARERWRQWHLVLGLGLGGLLALLGLTGSLLVYYPELDTWLHPELAWQPADGRVQAWEPVLQALQRAEPGRERGWRIELPPEGAGHVTARYLRPAERPGPGFTPLLVTLHAGTLEPLARRYWGEFAMTWLYDLHYTLLLGDTGLWVVGLAGLATLGSLASGLWLWWPTSRRQWAQAGRWKRGAGRARRTWDQHRLSGLYGLPLLATLVATGALLALPSWTMPAVRAFSPLPNPPQPRSTPPADLSQARRIPLDQALAAAQARFPQATARWVDTPDGPQGTFRVRLQQPGEPSPRFPRTFVWVDAWSGQVLDARDARAHTGGEVFLAWLHPLHNGQAFGPVGRALACLGGLLLPVLAWTGLRRWWDRRRGQRARRPAG